MEEQEQEQGGGRGQEQEAQGKGKGGAGGRAAATFHRGGSKKHSAPRAQLPSSATLTAIPSQPCTLGV